MKKNNKITYWAFIVDTDQYSGNFLEEISHYMVGCNEEVDTRFEYVIGLFDEECANSEHRDIYTHLHLKIIDPGDDGIHRGFFGIWPTPGFFNNGCGGHFADGQEEEALKHYNEQVQERASSYSVKPLKKLRKYDAYQSVAIFFDKELTQDQIAFLDERARKFTSVPKQDEWDHRPNIIGTRFIKIVETVKETEVWKNGQ